MGSFRSEVAQEFEGIVVAHPDVLLTQPAGGLLGDSELQRRPEDPLEKDFESNRLDPVPRK
jgi:hypothetical protein